MRIEKNTYGRSSLWLCMLSSLVLATWAAEVSPQDGHIDPSPIAHRYGLTFTRHPDTSFSLATATAGLSTTTQLLRTCNSRIAADQDVAAAVTVGTSGSLGSFGVAGDTQDVVTTEAEMTALLANNTAYVKVINTILSCGGPTTGAVGCAPPGSTMVIVDGLGSSDTGETVVHELGHNRGLSHRETPGNPIMKASGFGANEVNLAEVAAYHTAGTDDGPNRPVDLEFIIDDTGSMTEEIGGVRSSLTSHLGTFSANDCQAFQLTTFKDDVTERLPTTDLAAITSQVSGLTALGGGDCPEASVQALDQVRDKIKDGGRAFFATDASPQAGQNLSATIAALRGRGVRVDVLLSGDCVGKLGGAGAFSSNSGLPKLERVEGVSSSIAAFSELAERTGGVFAFIPEVNSSAAGAMRYGFVSFNVMQGSRVPSLALVTPGSAPAGSQVAVTVRASNTNFQPGTTMAVSGSGVAVQSVTVRSPIELIVTLNISPGAAPGFRDLIATTGAEVAKGTGALEVTGKVVAPTITSISPNTARAGQALTVSVLGASTHFNASSVLNLGEGISVSSVTVLSPQSLAATIHLDAGADVGFRDATVLTGGELATESLTGPFFVAPPPSEGIPTVTLITPPSAAPGTNLVVEIEGINTVFANGVSEVSFGGAGVEVLSTTVESPTRLSASISIAPDATPGFRDVRVTTGSEIAAALGGFLVGGGTVPPSEIPTLSSALMVVFVLALLGLGIVGIRRRRESF